MDVSETLKKMAQEARNRDGVMPIDKPNVDLGYCKDGRRRWRRKPHPNKLISKTEVVRIVVNRRLIGRTYDQIARELSIPEQSLIEMAQQVEFKRLYNDAISKAKESARNAILEAVPGAITTLAYLSASACSEHVRYEAAQAIITHAELAKEVLDEQSSSDYDNLIEGIRKRVGKLTITQVNINEVKKEEPIGSTLPALEGEFDVLPSLDSKGA